MITMKIYWRSFLEALQQNPHWVARRASRATGVNYEAYSWTVTSCVPKRVAGLYPQKLRLLYAKLL